MLNNKILKIMKKNIKFIDNDNNLVKVEFTNENGYLSLTGDYANNSCGQIYDMIKPHTDLQRELVDVWKERHLKNDNPSLVEKISTIMDKVQHEYDDFYASLLPNDNYPSIEDEGECLEFLDKCFFEDDSPFILSAIKANDYDLRVIPYVDVADTHSYQKEVTIFGVDYYVCKEERLDDIAREYLEDDDEFWREAVRCERTTLGLSDWIDDAISIDGAMSVLGWSEIDTISVRDDNYLVAVQD